MPLIPRPRKTLDQDRADPKLDWERRIGPDPGDPRFDSCPHETRDREAHKHAERCITLSLEAWLVRQQRCLNCPLILTDLLLQHSRCGFCLRPLCPSCKELLDGLCMACHGVHAEQLESRLPARGRAAGSAEAATSASASSAPPTLPQGSEASFQILHSEEEQEARHP